VDALPRPGGEAVRRGCPPPRLGRAHGAHGETSWRLAVERSNGHDAELPAAFYRNVGKAHDVREYTPEQARMLAHEAGHFGPWE
jgi:hypothetical protein